MKVPPKRKGNSDVHPRNVVVKILNESPSEKEGKFEPPQCKVGAIDSSMKVPPKRKGNEMPAPAPSPVPLLNESPSEKEGKLTA